MPKKNNHTHKTVFTWFGNLPTSTKLQGFHYYLGRIQSTRIAATILFLLPSRMRQQQPTILKTLIIAKSVQIYEMGPKKIFPGAYRPKPPFHGLSFSKFPIKNHAILFRSSRVVKPDQTKLDSTKPNSQVLVRVPHNIRGSLKMQL